MAFDYCIEWCTMYSFRPEKPTRATIGHLLSRLSFFNAFNDSFEPSCKITLLQNALDQPNLFVQNKTKKNFNNAFLNPNTLNFRQIFNKNTFEIQAPKRAYLFITVKNNPATISQAPCTKKDRHRARRI